MTAVWNYKSPRGIRKKYKLVKRDPFVSYSLIRTVWTSSRKHAQDSFGRSELYYAWREFVYSLRDLWAEITRRPASKD